MTDSRVKTSLLYASNAPYVEELYDRYLNDPLSVSEDWKSYFDSLQVLPATDGKATTRDISHTPIITAFAERAKNSSRKPAAAAKADPDAARKQVAVQSIIAAYRFLGSRRASLDPLERREKPVIPELEPSFYGLEETDMESQFSVANTYFGPKTMTLRQIVHALQETYCGTIGIEFMYISDPVIKRWWQEKLESCRARPHLEKEARIRTLLRLTEAEGLERYLHTKYVGQKRFSLEGGESFIVALDRVVEKAAQFGTEDMVIGMAHRGRLNVLVNILGKAPRDLFAEFEGKYSGADLPAGDVKYHNGFSSDIMTASGPIHLALAFNPSHLEIVDPVVAGSVRARQDRFNDPKGKKVLGVMVHGDAAFAGQGVVMETLNLADTRGYGTGGTVHIVINNQIGFTTSDPRDKGSMTYSTDPAKLIEAPVLHVNADDVDSVVMATDWAMEFRDRFGYDVVLDIVCFRKLGHNEQDTPALTQPLMYRKIAKHPGTRAVYADRLAAQNVITKEDAEAMVRKLRQDLEERGDSRKLQQAARQPKTSDDWRTYRGKWSDYIHTAVSEAEIQEIGEAITTVPEGFQMHPLLAKVVSDRKAMIAGEIPVDWGLAEHLAFATLLRSGYSVRISGEDSGRGTFMHRHAVWHDQGRSTWDTGVWIPLEHLSENQGRFSVYDSVLSEEAVLGFEYGYSASAPQCLTIWEAQFGDFANGAQVVIDQFISSGEAKWGRKSGLVMMLPHGYEGQGPEHSSARVERYLQLCADDNMLVIQPTTAAQIFHLLRRQMVGLCRKPLIIFTPKSLLRNKAASSPMEAFVEGGFLPVIGECEDVDRANVSRILVCSGKIYYDLIKARAERKREDIAIIRIEQLYPFPEDKLGKELEKYSFADEIVWVQDEPQNQGPWNYAHSKVLAVMRKGQTLSYAGRPASSSPAVGYAARHHEQLKQLIETAFGPVSGLVMIK